MDSRGVIGVNANEVSVALDLTEPLREVIPFQICEAGLVKM